MNGAGYTLFTVKRLPFIRSCPSDTMRVDNPVEMKRMQSVGTNQRGEQSEASATPPPAELVQRVADEVYRLLLHDLKLERERRGVRRVRGDSFSQRTVYAPAGRNRP
jgi:hypothetical protein